MLCDHKGLTVINGAELGFFWVGFISTGLLSILSRLSYRYLDRAL